MLLVFLVCSGTERLYDTKLGVLGQGELRCQMCPGDYKAVSYH